MPKPKYQCMTKGTNREKGEPRYSLNWIISKRGFLKFYDTYIKLGSWKFYYNKIENPIVYKSKTFFFIPVEILTFDYNDNHYQFGFNPWANPLTHLPFSPKIEIISLKMSVFSIIIRIAVLAYLVYWIIEKF